MATLPNNTTLDDPQNETLEVKSIKKEVIGEITMKSNDEPEISIKDIGFMETPKKEKRSLKRRPIRQQDLIISVKHYENLIGELRCPECAEFMRAPILQCVSGHSVCERCSKNLQRCTLCKMSEGLNICDGIFNSRFCNKMLRKNFDTNKFTAVATFGNDSDFASIRSLTLEALAAKFHFACPNVKNGCTVRMPQALMGWHDAKCSYKNVKCFMGIVWGDCTWTGFQSDWLGHILEKHLEKVWRIPEVMMTWHFEDATNPVTAYYIFRVYNELFNLYQIYDKVNSKMLWTLTCASKDRITKFDYSYEIRLCHSGKIVTYQFPCHNEDDEDIIQDGTCVVISIFDLVRFLDENKLLSYNVKIIRIPRSVEQQQPKPLPRKAKKLQNIKAPDVTIIDTESGNHKAIPANVIITKPLGKNDTIFEEPSFRDENEPSIIEDTDEDAAEPELERFVSDIINKQMQPSASTPKLSSHRKYYLNSGSNFSLQPRNTVAQAPTTSAGKLKKFFSMKNINKMTTNSINKVSQSLQNLKISKNKNNDDVKNTGNATTSNTNKSSGTVNRLSCINASDKSTNRNVLERKHSESKLI